MNEGSTATRAWDRIAVAGPDRALEALEATEASPGGAFPTRRSAKSSGRLTGRYWLVVSLLYGSGLRLLEALHLRVKDVDLGTAAHPPCATRKGMKDRVTVLPDRLVEPLRRQLQWVRTCHERGDRLRVMAALNCRPPWSASIRAPTLTSAGSTSSRQIDLHVIRAAEPGDVITCTRIPVQRQRTRGDSGRWASREPASCHTFRAIRHASARVWLRHSHAAGTARPQRCPDDADLPHVLNRGGRGVRSPMDVG